MGAKIKNFDINFDAEIREFTVDKMSTNIVRIMDKLAGNEDVFKLLYYLDGSSLKKDLKDDPIAKAIFDKKSIIKNKDENQKIKAFPFDPEPATEETILIRVYYSNGNIEADGVYSNSQINIDIICSHDYWLTSDSELKLIRPYALMSRINQLLTEDKMDKLPRPTAFKQLTVNSKFECLRLYTRAVAIESDGGTSEFS